MFRDQFPVPAVRTFCAVGPISRARAGGPVGERRRRHRNDGVVPRDKLERLGRRRIRGVAQAVEHVAVTRRGAEIRSADRHLNGPGQDDRAHLPVVPQGLVLARRQPHEAKVDQAGLPAASSKRREHAPNPNGPLAS